MTWDVTLDTLWRRSCAPINCNGRIRHIFYCGRHSRSQSAADQLCSARTAAGTYSRITCTRPSMTVLSKGGVLYVGESNNNFEYVVTKKSKPRLCFGTSLDREVLPTKGAAMSPFMRRLAGETRPNLGPGSYDCDRDAFYDLTHRIYSKYGLGAKESRWVMRHEHQPPPRPPPKKKPFSQNCAPFNQTGKRKPLFVASDYPAACDYCPEYKKRQMKFAYSFQGKKVLRCAVMIKCVPYNLDACGYCGCSCSAQGDYWQFENRIFLCRRHYTKLFTHCLAKFQGAKLAEFKSVRDCFFAHAHNSCKAALKIMKSEEIEKKLRKEAYLDLYFPQRRFCNN